MKTEYRKLEETDKTGEAVGRPSCGSSFLGHPDAKFFCEERGTDTKQEETGQKERTDAFGGTHDK